MDAVDLKNKKALGRLKTGRRPLFLCLNRKVRKNSQKRYLRKNGGSGIEGTIGEHIIDIRQQLQRLIRSEDKESIRTCARVVLQKRTAITEDLRNKLLLFIFAVFRETKCFTAETA